MPTRAPSVKRVEKSPSLIGAEDLRMRVAGRRKTHLQRGRPWVRTRGRPIPGGQPHTRTACSPRMRPDPGAIRGKTTDQSSQRRRPDRCSELTLRLHRPTGNFRANRRPMRRPRRTAERDVAAVVPRRKPIGPTRRVLCPGKDSTPGRMPAGSRRRIQKAGPRFVLHRHTGDYGGGLDPALPTPTAGEDGRGDRVCAEGAVA